MIKLNKNLVLIGALFLSSFQSVYALEYSTHVKNKYQVIAENVFGDHKKSLVVLKKMKLDSRSNEETVVFRIYKEVSCLKGPCFSENPIVDIPNVGEEIVSFISLGKKVSLDVQDFNHDGLPDIAFMTFMPPQLGALWIYTSNMNKGKMDLLTPQDEFITTYPFIADYTEIKSDRIVIKSEMTEYSEKSDKMTTRTHIREYLLKDGRFVIKK